MPTVAATLAPGVIIGGYRIEEVIGLGPKATVYRAEQMSLGRQVALKVLAAQPGLGAGLSERLRREVRQVAALGHPHLLTVYDSREADGPFCVAMSLVDGRDLGERLRDPGLSAADTASTLGPIADALDAAHAAGLVHGDVKPQNILIRADGRPYLADFGGSYGGGSPDGLTETGPFVANAHYLAPEQIRGGSATAASDVYALTAVMYHCLTGHAPYPGDTEADVLQAHLTKPPPTLAGLMPRHPAMEEVLARGMATDPARRYASAGRLMDDAIRALTTLQAADRLRVPTYAGQRDHTDAALTVIDFPLHSAMASTVADGWQRHTQADEIGGVTAPYDGPRRKDATARRRRPPRLRRRLGLSVMSLVLLGAVLVAVVLREGGTARAPVIYRASSGPLTVHYNHTWRPSSHVGVQWRGAFMKSALALQTTGTGSAVLGAGVLRDMAADPAGAPPYLRVRFGRPTNSGGALVAGHRGRQYLWTIGRGRWLVGYVLATDALDLGILCQTTSMATIQACGRLAQRAVVSGVHILSPGPDASFAAAVSTDLRPPVRAGTALAHAGGAGYGPRADRASKLSATDRSAVRALEAQPAPPRYRGAIATLARALGAESAAAGSLSFAARARRRRDYALARVRLIAASRAVVRADLRLRSDGVPVTGLHALALPVAPPVPRKRAHTVAPAVPSPAATTPTSTVAPVAPPSYSAPAPTPTHATPTPTPSPRPSPPAPVHHGQSGGGSGVPIYKPGG